MIDNDSTGALKMPAVNYLIENYLPVVVVNPNQVRDFVKAIGRLAKSDSIDADTIACFERDIHPEIRPIKDEHTAIIGLE